MSNTKARRLNDEAIYQILTRLNANQRDLAAELGVSSKVIYSVAIGKAYTDVFPEMPRRGVIRKSKKKTCVSCVHLCNGRCTMEFPEFKLRGDRAAYICAAFTEAHTCVKIGEP